MKELLDRLNKFGETTAGKAVLIGITILMLAVAFFAVRGVLVPQAPEEPAVQPPGQVNQAAPTEKPEAADQESEAQKPATMPVYTVESGFEVFSKDILRDPFSPLQVETTQVATAQPEVKTEKPLALLGITYDASELKAIVSYEGNVQTIAPGDTVGSYLLVSVSENSARFLYGDMPLYLEVGQVFQP